MPVLSKKQVFYSDNPKSHTSGGLYKSDLVKNKSGRIVSRKKHEAGKRAYKANGLVPKSAAQMAELRGMRRRK